MNQLYRASVHKFASEVLKDRYANHQEIIDRVCNCLMVERDVQEFLKLLSDSFEVGFLHATGQLEKLGYPLTVESEKKV